MGKRILVADDSRTIQQAFAMVLDGSGHSLSFAKSTEEALAAARRDGRPDLVLSDAVLGSGSGYDLCAELKADAGLRDVPVYILASAQSPYDEARGRKVGANGQMAKPFESQTLLDAVAMALAAPVASSPAAMPQKATSFDDNTARFSSQDFPMGDDDDDSYGEITIERGPGATPAAPAAPAWAAAKPAARPSTVRPISAATPVSPAPVPQPSPRPSLIPGARPSGSMPAAAPTAQPAPPPGMPRPPVNRTMMGFPAVKPPIAGKSSAPAMPGSSSASAASGIPASPMAPAPSRPSGSIGTATATGSRPSMLPTPPAPAAAMSVKASLPGLSGTSAGPATPVAPAPLPTSGARPGVPRLSPPPASAPVAAPPSPVTRKVPTPTAPTDAVPAPPPVAASATGSSASALPVSVASAVSSAVDRKVAALAARGPEFEAIAKLSREIIEQVVWEVVPELAETIIRQEIDRLASAKK